jgi:hypothetical protein
MLFHTQQDATGSRSRCGTLPLDIRVAGLSHGGSLQQRRSALFTEILEMHLDAFRKKISLRLRRVTKLCHVARASRYDRGVLPERRGD